MINKYSKIIKRSVFVSIVIIAIVFSCFVMVKYEVEGEKTLPFYLNKILLISTVDGKTIEETGTIWNLDLSQNNDLYLYISKEQSADEILKNITIENFQIIQKPSVGQVKIFRPTGELSNLYTYSQQNYINDKIEFKGSTIDDLKSLEIANQGGIIGIRITNDNIGKYVSDSDSEVKYDGTLLTKSNISEENIKFAMSFDIIIETEKNIKYKGTIKLEMPSEDLIKNGTSRKEITDFADVIFKRIK